MTLFFFPVKVLNDIFFQQSYATVGHWTIVEEKCAKMQKQKNVANVMNHYARTEKYF